MKRKLNLIAAGFVLTALTYGLARFAYGLMLPDIRADLAMDAVTAGWIGGSAFAAYCLGIGLAFALGARFSPRLLTVLAGVLATSGLALAAAAWSPLSLGMAMALAGLGTGLTSPPLATAVATAVKDMERPRANGAINAGTAAGIIFSGLAVILFPGGWRGLYVVFAGIGAAVSFWLAFAVPANEPNDVARAPLELNKRHGVATLCVSALLAGAASTSIWTFGANLLREAYEFSDVQIAAAWIMLGLGGTLGVGTGVLTGRFGIAHVHRLAIGGMALPMVGLGLAGVAPLSGYVAMAVFGLAYIVSSGVFLLWGIELYDERPAFGLGLPLLTLALGQTAGAPLFGTLWDLTGAAPTLGCFAALMCAALVWAPSPLPRTSLPLGN